MQLRLHCRSETLQLPDPPKENSIGSGPTSVESSECSSRAESRCCAAISARSSTCTEEFILGVPTNATRGLQHAANLIGKIAFVNVGLEGPRSTTNRVRGDYDQVMGGVRAFLDYGLPISLSAVVYRSTLHALPYTYQIADVLGAGKLKLILPLRKGNALDLGEHEFISLDEAAECFDRLRELRAIHDWRPALRMTTWTPQTEGHMIVVEPTGKANAWPVYDAPDLFEPLGNLLHEPVTEIWARYRFKRNHFAKYLGASIRAVSRRASAVPGGGDA